MRRRPQARRPCWQRGRGAQRDRPLQSFQDHLQAVLPELLLIRTEEYRPGAVATSSRNEERDHDGKSATLDLLKQEVATQWNTWRGEHPDTAIKLNGVDLSGANLGEVNLAGADLSQADLSGADLNHANLSKATLAGADLSGAILAAADLSAADLSEANLSNADLIEADLTGANLHGAALFAARLNWATLEGAIITPEQLRQARVGRNSL